MRPQEPSAITDLPAAGWQNAQRAASRLHQQVRQFFEGAGYLEVTTPILVATPGLEGNLGYFATHWHDNDGRPRPLFLRSSPELHMKCLMAAGGERLFQLGPSFRDGVGEYGRWHQPEFTLLEWYEADCDLEGLATRTLELLMATEPPPALRRELAAACRWSVFDAFQEFAGIELHDGDPELAARARAAGVEVAANDDFVTAYFKVLVGRVEPALARLGAVVLWDYPPSQAALARVVDGRAKRFELYVRGIELCNGFWELTDPADNAQRFGQAQRSRGEDGRVQLAPDPDFAAALEAGLPPCSGNALGLDRWLALKEGWPDLSPLYPFRGPHHFSSRRGSPEL